MMDCQQAQNDLLSAESLKLLRPELSAHIAECADCQALLVKLRRLEAEANALPVPPGHEHPSPEFLRQMIQVAANSGSSVRRGIRRVIAAAVVLAFALAATSLIFFNGSTVQADVLIGQLVDWNLAIAHTHDTASRNKVYQQQAAELQKQVTQGKLAPADRALALALLDNAQWMTTEKNAADESQHFQSLANQLLQRQQAASDGAATHLQQIYQELVNQGVSNGSGSATSPSSRRQNSMPKQSGSPSASSLQINSALAEINEVPVNSAVAKSTNAAFAPTTHTNYSGTFVAGGDAQPANFPHSAAAVNTETMHATGVHAHHETTHVAANDPVVSSTDAAHTAPGQANEPSAPISKSDVDLTSRAITSALPPPPAPPPAVAPPEQSSEWKKSPLWSSAHLSDHDGQLASLESMDAFGQFRCANPPPDFDMGTADQLTDLTPPPPGAGDVPLSRYAMESLLAEHINNGSFAGSDLDLRDPPPMGAEMREFFSGGNWGAPVPFPEPPFGLLPLVGILALRRQRRIK